MATIGARTLKAVARQIESILMDHRREIDEAFCRDDSEKNFVVDLKAVFAPGKNGGISHFARIGFIAERVKDECGAEETDEHGSYNGALFDHADAERMKRRRILFRDFRPFAAFLDAQERKRRIVARGDVLFKTFAA